MIIYAVDIVINNKMDLNTKESPIPRDAESHN